MHNHTSCTQRLATFNSENKYWYSLCMNHLTHGKQMAPIGTLQQMTMIWHRKTPHHLTILLPGWKWMNTETWSELGPVLVSQLKHCSHKTAFKSIPSPAIPANLLLCQQINMCASRTAWKTFCKKCCLQFSYLASSQKEVTEFFHQYTRTEAHELCSTCIHSQIQLWYQKHIQASQSISNWAGFDILAFSLPVLSTIFLKTHFFKTIL